MPEPLIVGDLIGGQPKQKYWTPDGRMIQASPNIHGTSDGGIRDANFDKGWLLIKPTNPKLYCSHCDMWHDTETEVAECGAQKRVYNNKWGRWAKKNNKGDSDKDKEIDNLKKQLSEIKGILDTLVAKGG